MISEHRHRLPVLPRLMLLFCALALLSPLAPGEELPAITWPERLYNPSPEPHDLVLPLACGGAMVFRPVEIPSGNLLDDRPVELGQSDSDRGYKEGRRITHLAGSFSETDAAARRYYIGKYEVTLDQYRALQDADCPTPSIRGRVPVTSISWFDAVDFSRRYSEWLLSHARASLPVEGQEPGFLRLPSEDEWEFAARGGLAVDETAFLATVFPMPEGDLSAYAWHESSGSAEGRLRPVGLLKPNPLALHDILGNASEMTLAPFHLDRRGREHGQAGGFVSRGGDIFTPRGQIGSAVRQEHNYFDANTGKARVMDSMGMRLVLTAPVIVSSARLDAIKKAWDELPQLSTDTWADAAAALRELTTLAEQTRDPTLRAQIDLIQRDIERTHTALSSARKRTVRALVRMGAFMGKRVATNARHAEAVRRLIALAERQTEESIAGMQGQRGSAAAIAQIRAHLQEKQEKWQGQLADIEQETKDSLSYYGDMVIGVGRDYSDKDIQTQLEVLRVELREKHNEFLIPYAEIFARHLSEYRAAGKADPEHWQTSLLAIDS